MRERPELGADEALSELLDELIGEADDGERNRVFLRGIQARGWATAGALWGRADLTHGWSRLVAFGPEDELPCDDDLDVLSTSDPDVVLRPDQVLVAMGGDGQETALFLAGVAFEERRDALEAVFWTLSNLLTADEPLGLDERVLPPFPASARCQRRVAAASDLGHLLACIRATQERLSDYSGESDNAEELARALDRECQRAADLLLDPDAHKVGRSTSPAQVLLDVVASERAHAERLGVSICVESHCDNVGIVDDGVVARILHRAVRHTSERAVALHATGIVIDLECTRQAARAGVTISFRVTGLKPATGKLPTFASTVPTDLNAMVADANGQLTGAVALPEQSRRLALWLPTRQLD